MGKYNCAKCGDWASFDAEFVDFGSFATCEHCGEKTVFALLTTENYPVALAAITTPVAAQPVVAPDRPQPSNSASATVGNVGGG